MSMCSNLQVRHDDLAPGQPPLTTKGDPERRTGELRSQKNLAELSHTLLLTGIQMNWAPRARLVLTHQQSASNSLDGVRKICTEVACPKMARI
jgi:hypothetical protein